MNRSFIMYGGSSTSRYYTYHVIFLIRHESFLVQDNRKARDSLEAWSSKKEKKHQLDTRNHNIIIIDRTHGEWSSNETNAILRSKRMYLYLYVVFPRLTLYYISHP